MKKIFLGFTILCLFANTSCNEDIIENNEKTTFDEINNNVDDEAPDVSPVLEIPEVKSIETEIVNLINAYRVDNGLLALKLEKGIVKLKAKEHNLYMINRNAISHDLFDNRSNEIINAIEATRVGENVAFGYTTAKDLVDAWIASNDHRKNILGDFNFFEISAEQTSNNVWYFTNIFVKK